MRKFLTLTLFIFVFCQLTVLSYSQSSIELFRDTSNFLDLKKQYDLETNKRKNIDIKQNNKDSKENEEYEQKEGLPKDKKYSEIEKFYCEINNHSPYISNKKLELIQEFVKKRYFDDLLAEKSIQELLLEKQIIFDEETEKYELGELEHFQINSIAKNEYENACNINYGYYFLNNELIEKPFIEQVAYDVFESKNSQETISSQFQITPDYILGPGDKLDIYIWGKIDKHQYVEINSQGSIVLESVGELTLAGVKYKDVQRVIKNFLSTKFVNFDVTITVSELKKISVSLFGELNKPGEYHVSSSSSIIDLLYSAGGIKKSGSLRQLKHIRNGKVIAKYDLYNFFYGLSQQTTLPLEHNDIIQVLPLRKTLGVIGQVGKEGIYEINNQMSLEELISLTGGHLSNSYPFDISINRRKGTERVYETISVESFETYRKIKNKVFFRPTDLIYFFNAQVRNNNYVMVKGEVLQPGKYEYNKKLTLQKVIKSSRGFTENALTNQIELTRFVNERKRKSFHLDSDKDANFKIMPSDEITIYSIKKLSPKLTVTIHGDVLNEGIYEYYDNLKLSNLLLKAELKYFTNKGFLEVYRRQQGKNPEILKIDLNEVLNNPESVSNIVLKPFDQVSVYHDNIASDVRKVELFGEVKFPGTYFVSKGERFSDVIQRAGGFKEDAHVRASRLIRKSVLEREDNASERASIANLKSFIYDKTKIDKENSYSLEDYSSLQILEKNLIKNSGRIVLNINSFEKFKYSENDIVLENNDKIFIPKQAKSITLIGAFNNNTNLIHKDKTTLNTYISHAGGFSKFADRGELRIFKVDGSVTKNTNTIEPGDIIFVPYEIKTPWYSGIITITKILSNLGVMVAAINVFK